MSREVTKQVIERAEIANAIVHRRFGEFLLSPTATAHVDGVEWDEAPDYLLTGLAESKLSSLLGRLPETQRLAQ